tara:strand:+ start:377 stop:853 length:477 start_codon:yes stop_codon:yes gene_type:complete
MEVDAKYVKDNIEEIMVLFKRLHKSDARVTSKVVFDKRKKLEKEWNSHSCKSLVAYYYEKELAKVVLHNNVEYQTELHNTIDNLKINNTKLEMNSNKLHDENISLKKSQDDLRKKVNFLMKSLFRSVEVKNRTRDWVEGRIKEPPDVFEWKTFTDSSP